MKTNKSHRWTLRISITSSGNTEVIQESDSGIIDKRRGLYPGEGRCRPLLESVEARAPCYLFIEQLKREVTGCIQLVG
jgi:hypothetical protein